MLGLSQVKVTKFLKFNSHITFDAINTYSFFILLSSVNLEELFLMSTKEGGK